MILKIILYFFNFNFFWASHFYLKFHLQKFYFGIQFFKSETVRGLSIISFLIFSIFFKISKSKKSVVSLDITLKKRKRRFFKKLVIFELLQLFNFSDNFQNPFCISCSSEFSVHDFIIVWSFCQHLSSVICFLPRDDFARILLAERRLSSRSILHAYLEREKRVREREKGGSVLWCCSTRTNS